LQPANERGAGDKFFEILKRKIFSKKVAKKFGDNEKVRIFAVPKRKGGPPGRMKGKSSLKILKRQAV
jgi:hypothetical protein